MARSLTAATGRINYEQGWSGVIWACHKVKGLKIARSFEIPFANANGAVVTPESCSGFGRGLAQVFHAMLGSSSVSVGKANAEDEVLGRFAGTNTKLVRLTDMPVVCSEVHSVDGLWYNSRKTQCWSSARFSDSLNCSGVSGGDPADVPGNGNRR